MKEISQEQFESDITNVIEGKVSLKQLEGNLSSEISEIRKEVILTLY